MAPRRPPPDDAQRWAHVRRVEDEHPPIDVASVDFTIRRPGLVLDRYGTTFDYMARVELEVERNILELGTLLPDVPEIDRYFYRDVWFPQESRHGQLLDEVLVSLGHRPAAADVDTLSTKIHVVGALAHLSWFHDVVRMLYYLTGVATERSAVIAYSRLVEGLRGLGESSLAETVIAPIRRQEPGHFAYYQMSARALWGQLSGWQRWLVRRLRERTFAPVGANNAEQRADVGDMLRTFGFQTPDAASDFALQVARVEAELIWAEGQGLKVPAYVVRSFADAVELAIVRERRSLAA